jgi:hypothetical protein
MLVADIKECSIQAPHEAHPWQENRSYDGFVPQQIPIYHHCNGKVWKNNEVFNHLQFLIREALKEPRYIMSGEPSQDEQIMAELWPKVVGFLQPEDMPLKLSANQANLNEEDLIKQWDIGRSQIMMLPPDPQERIADALEKIAKFTDSFGICDHGNVEAFCGPCIRNNPHL